MLPLLVLVLLLLLLLPVLVLLQQAAETPALALPFWLLRRRRQWRLEGGTLAALV